MQVAFVSLLFAALARQALAAIFITDPTSSTTAQGGQSLNINWKDDGSAPTLADIGLCEIGLYAGNKQQQTELQQISTSVDVSKQTTLNFTIDATIGSNYNGYFIRFTAINLKDPNNPMFPYEAFSGLFALNGMSGQFSPSVQAQINGVTSAGSVSATPTAGTSASPSISQTKASITTSGTAVPASASVSSSSAPKSTHTSAASTMRGNVGVLSVIGVVVGLAGLTL